MDAWVRDYEDAKQLADDTLALIQARPLLINAVTGARPRHSLTASPAPSQLSSGKSELHIAGMG